MGYPWCPGKATWDREAVSIFNILKVAAETGSLWQAGGIADQPHWFVDLLAWFLPSYNDLKFNSRARSILGDGKVSDVLGSSSPKPARRG